MTENEMTRRAALGAVGATVGMVAVGTAIAQTTPEGKAGKLRLFERVDPSQVTKGAPPLAFHPVPDGRIVFKTQEELKAWEEEIRSKLGVELRGTLGHACETCSAGCTDDCG